MLEFSDVTFAYTPDRGLLGAQLKIAPGETVGIVGGNGAGKSTLLGLAADALIPQIGHITLTLPETHSRLRRFRSATGIGYRRHVGYLTEVAPVYSNMTVIRYLRFRARLHGISVIRAARRVREIMELCRLTAHRRELIGALSMGLRRRVALAEALVGRPAVLVLDDPFAGMDADIRSDFIRILGTLPKTSHILIGGHDPELMASCCTRFVLLREGRIVSDRLTADAARRLLCPPTDAESADKEDC